MKKILHFSFKVIEEARSDSRSLLMAGYGRARARIGVPRLKDSNDIHANFLSKQFHNFIGTLRSIIIHARVVNTLTEISIPRSNLPPPCPMFTMGSVWGTKFCSKSLLQRSRSHMRLRWFDRERKIDARLSDFSKENGCISETSATNLKIENLFSGDHDRTQVNAAGIFFSTTTIKPWRSSNTNEFWIGWMGYYRRVPEFIMHFITKRGFYRTPMGSMNHYFEIFSGNEL